MLRRNPKYVAAQQAQLARSAPANYDIGNPTHPVGHALGVEISTNITSNFRATWRPESMNITPQQVVETIVDAGVRQWVLMGLYGYVGYLAQPRATQDVDVMVAPEEKETAIRAIMARWPKLTMRDQSPIVVRFADPGETHSEQPPQVVIDIMLPNDECQLAILQDHVIVDAKTGHRLPTLEAALASKYSAIVSPYREWNRKSYDAGDLRSMIMPNPSRIDQEAAFKLGELIFEGGGKEILEFIQLAIENKPFPV